LPAISARLVDGHTDPSPVADALATERLVRLDPCFLCYRPPAGAPPVSPLPAAGAGAKGITFGSFNALTKLNRAVLEAWRGVLARVPGSRLVIKARELATPDCREHLLGRCRAAGLDVARVEVVPPTVGMEEHLSAYGRVDIALDTFPYGGTTTTCDALWMGVPVVSVAPEGAGHAARVGLSLLSAVGLADWCVSTVEGYVERAVRAAADVPALAALRSGLRARMGASCLCDEAGFAARFGAGIERVAGLRR
jgi:predicted O-linked N-acetylglucosamine transferase (SPINDLY family)